MTARGARRPCPACVHVALPGVVAGSRRKHCRARPTGETRRKTGSRFSASPGLTTSPGANVGCAGADHRRKRSGFPRRRQPGRLAESRLASIGRLSRSPCAARFPCDPSRMFENRIWSRQAPAIFRYASARPSSRNPVFSSSPRDALFSGRHAASKRPRSSRANAWCTNAVTASLMYPDRAYSRPIQKLSVPHCTVPRRMFLHASEPSRAWSEFRNKSRLSSLTFPEGSVGLVHPPPEPGPRDIARKGRRDPRSVKLPACPPLASPADIVGPSRQPQFNPPGT